MARNKNGDILTKAECKEAYLKAKDAKPLNGEIPLGGGAVKKVTIDK